MSVRSNRCCNWTGLMPEAASKLSVRIVKKNTERIMLLEHVTLSSGAL